MACNVDQTCGDAVYNFPCYKTGTTFTAKQFQIVINDVPPVSAIASVEMKIYRDGIEKLSLTTPNGITLNGADTFTIDSQVFPLSSYSYTYNLWVTFADGVVKSWVKGSFKVEA